LGGGEFEKLWEGWNLLLAGVNPQLLGQGQRKNLSLVGGQGEAGIELAEDKTRRKPIIRGKKISVALDRRVLARIKNGKSRG